MQQLTAARTNGCHSAGPAPSELREKLVQTDHTELSQVRTDSKVKRLKRLHLMVCKCISFIVFSYLSNVSPIMFYVYNRHQCTESFTQRL